MINKELYENLSYDKNNFDSIRNTKSILRWGNLESYPNPYISFVIPAYSRVRELATAVESIVSQEELFSYEILIVDDAPDAIEENKKLEYINKLNNQHILYYANEKNLGVEGNWNRCIELARAPYVSMLHDDDILCPSYFVSIKQCIKTVEKYSKKFGVIQANLIPFRDELKIPEVHPRCRGGLKKVKKINCLYNGKGPVSPPSCGTLFSKQAVIEIGGFNSAYFPCADYLLGYFMVEKGYDCYVSEDVFGWYRFGINESVKPNVIQDTIKCNYYFLHWLYKRSMFNKIWAFFLGKAHVSYLVDEYNAARKIWCDFVVPKEMDSIIVEYGNSFIGKLGLKLSRKTVLFFTKRIYWS